MKKIDENDTQWKLVYDFQRTDSWDKKSVTINVFNHVAETLSQAIVIDNITKITQGKRFDREDCESAALRWANDISNKIMFKK